MNSVRVPGLQTCAKIKSKRKQKAKREATRKMQKVTKTVNTKTGALSGTGVRKLDGVIVDTRSEEFKKIQELLFYTLKTIFK